LQEVCKDVRTNEFGIHAGNIWQANTNLQFILDQIMQQSDQQFIDMLNRFKTATQTQNNIDTINSQCVQNPPATPNFHTCFRKMNQDTTQ
jgi:hypothetical protein